MNVQKQTLQKDSVSQEIQAVRKVGQSLNCYAGGRFQATHHAAGQFQGASLDTCITTQFVPEGY